MNRPWGSPSPIAWWASEGAAWLSLSASAGSAPSVIDASVTSASLPEGVYDICVLLAAGAPGIHFYALNKAPATRAVLGALRAARPWLGARGEAVTA